MYLDAGAGALCGACGRATRRSQRRPQNKMQKIPCALAQGIFHIRYSVDGAHLHRGLLALNVLVNGLCSSLACAHGLDDGGCAGHGIAAGVHTIAAGLAVVAVGDDAAMLVGLQTRGGGADQL